MQMAEIDEAAEIIGLGAIVYTFLKNGRERDIVFSWEEMLDFDGDSAPYVQYTYARARSILRKAEGEGQALPGTCAPVLTSEDEFAIAKLLDGFDQAVVRAAELYEPYILLRQVTALARAFNKYYNHEPILKTGDPLLRQSRLALLQAVCQAIRVGLDLVGIGVVERM